MKKQIMNIILIPDPAVSCKQAELLMNWMPVIPLLILTLLLLPACGEEPEPISEVNYGEVEFDPFVEREFPFITTSLLVSYDDGELIPENNVVVRCLALILGEESYACFDTDMLRWATAWTGDFVPMETMGQVSYSEFFTRNSRLPDLPAPPHIVTGLYPGWNAGEPVFSDPRPASPNPNDPSWGPLPPDIGRWNGVYVTDEGAVLSYSVNDVDIYETPGSIESEDETVFKRTFRIDQPESELSLKAGEVPGAISSESSPGRIEIYHPDGKSVTVMTLFGADDAVSLDVIEDRYGIVNVQQSDEPVEFTILIWKGDVDKADEIEGLEGSETFRTPAFRDGSSNLWPEVVRTRGRVSPDTSAYVVDELTMPVPNPWNRNIRVVDVAFFEDGRAALVTFGGDVWIVDGIDRGLRNLRWARFASGFFETQSIEIVDDQIYVFGKEGIVRLHDLNGNGSADYYENFSNQIHQSIETREWASDLVAKPGGGFYAAKGGALDMGPRGLTEPIARGFRGGSHHSGVVVEVSEDGRSAGVFASGFRGPYLGIHPETGLLTASDQEGHQVPSSPILIIERGNYFGVRSTAHRDPVPDITPPLLWIPHSVDRSGMSQVWINSDEMGPLSGDLIHFSYGRPGLFKVLIDSTGSGVQGGVSVIPGTYPAPTMKGAVSPADGQLYVAGFALWDTNSEGLTSFVRMRYTGEPSYLPEGFSVREGGIVLSFDEELDEESVNDISNYRVERWNYLRTEEYGSGHYRLDGSPGQEMLPVFSAHLSDDGKGVFLAIPNIEVVQQMELSYSINAVDGTEMEDQFWFTVNHVEPVNLLAAGFSNLDLDDLLADSGERELLDGNGEPVTVDRGRELFQRTGCIGCHSIDGSAGTERGPSLNGLFGTERRFQDGSTAIADEEYFRRAVTDPGSRVLEGYEEGMPSFLGILSDDEIDSIILYIKSLKE
jgi:mono/diheme cytochrome c family protein